MSPDGRDALRPTAADSSSSDDRPTVVGIGASAGGLAALKTLFAEVPEDSGLAWVVVVHLSPDHESHLADLLQRHVRIPVQQVTETVRLEVDRIYLIPPNANLEAIDTHLRLSKLEEQRRARAPVDHFFRTLARTYDGHAVGLVLTGTGSDGALGVKAIKEKGGLTVAQDPREAEYDGMPQSAIATGLIDLVLPLAEIPGAVLRFAHTEPRLRVGDEESEVAAEPRRLLQRIFSQVRARTGRDFTRYKQSTILRRISRRMQIHQLEQLDAYLDRLVADADEVRALSDDLLITVTSFFRDREVFERLEKQVIPELFAGRQAGDDLRFWSVGCATGEEAYSLAIVALDEAARQEAPPRIQVFASDLHEHSLQRARDGFFPGDIEADVSPERLRRYFSQEDGGYRVRKEVREIVVFAPHNLLADPPFSRLDLISCRNLLIYLQRDIQVEVAELFHYALRPNGYLVLGSSEAVDRSELFATEDKQLCLYRRRNVPTPEPRLPVFPLAHGRGGHELPPEPVGGRIPYGEFHARMVERLAPPSMLIGPDDKVVHLSEHAGRYLVHPGGEPTANVLKLVREELRLDLRAALAEARRGRAGRTHPVEVRFDGETCPVALDVRRSTLEERRDLVLVIFDERPADTDDDADGSGADAAPARPAPAAKPGGRKRELEVEVELLRRRLQTVIEESENTQEEMKAANEELQSANEELRSTMEELETSKEELHSMNEELQTVNQENRHRVEELGQLSDDLHNFLGASDIATLFLSRELRILRFTPRVEELFNVRPADRGRAISDLTHRLGYDELQDDAHEVLAQLIPIEREVRHQQGQWFLTRVLPYRSTQDRIEGVVITFVDITERKRAEEVVRSSEERLASELGAMNHLHELVTRLLECPDLATALDEVLEASMAITGARMGNVQLVDPSGEALSLVAHRGFEEDFLEHFGRVTPDDACACSRAWNAGAQVIVADVQTDPGFAAHREAAARAGFRGVQSTPLTGRNGEVLGVLSTHYPEPYRPSERDLRVFDLYARQAADFIERVRDEEALRDKTQRLEAEGERKAFFLATLGHELRNPLAALDGAMNVIQEGEHDPARLLAMMAAQIRQLKMLVNDLLEMARVTHGTISLRRARIDLAAVIREAAETVGSSLAAKEQELVLRIGEPVHVDGDRTRLEQVVVNLLSNASKFTPSGRRIEVALERDGDGARIEVRDEGRGLEAVDLTEIFEPFVQKESGHGGLGIGLALVKRLVELHGGSVSVSSAGKGRGSVFTVRLPIGSLEAEPAAPAPRRDWSGKPFSGTRVLIVDDARDAADALALLLQSRGAETECAYTGAEGVEKARSWKPRVALLDIALPDVAGFEVARRIRAQEDGDGVLLLAVTGFGDGRTESDALAAGFDERIVKPVELDHLYGLIARHLEGGRE